MAPTASRSFMISLVLAMALSIVPAPRVAAQNADAAFGSSLAEAKAAAVQAAAKQKAALEEELYPDGIGWKHEIGAQTVIPFAPDAAAQGARVSPDASYTPGHLCSPSDPNFKEYRYAEHIPYCNRVVTQQMKTEISGHYGVLQSAWSNYEFDHLIPLAIGGDSSIDNLWPQPHAPGTPNGSEDKDKLEEQLYLQMKAGTIQQADAVKQIYAWFTVSDMAHKIIQVAGR